MHCMLSVIPRLNNQKYEVQMKKMLVVGLILMSSAVFADGKYGKYSYCADCVDEYSLYKNEQTVSKYAEYEVGQYVYIAEKDASFQVQYIFSSGKAFLRKWSVKNGKIVIQKIKIDL